MDQFLVIPDRPVCHVWAQMSPTFKENIMLVVIALIFAVAMKLAIVGP